METEHLLLKPCPIQHLEKLLEGASAFKGAFGIEVVDGYIESPSFIQYSVEKLRSGLVQKEWWAYMILHKTDNSLIGIGGYKGAPDCQGVVEIGYGIAPAYRGKGYATEAASTLINNAINIAGVNAVWAHTLPEFNASTKVLQKCGMEMVEEIIDPDDGKVWRWQFRKGHAAGYL